MPTRKELPAVLTVLEVAKILRIAKMSVYHAIARGDLPSIRVGRRILIPRFALEQMLITPVSKVGRMIGAAAGRSL
jgi:excisionase family DNA binding protein